MAQLYCLEKELIITESSVVPYPVQGTVLNDTPGVGEGSGKTVEGRTMKGKKSFYLVGSCITRLNHSVTRLNRFAPS